MTDLEKVIEKANEAFEDLLKSIDKVNDYAVKIDIYNKLTVLIKVDDIVNVLTHSK